MPDRREFISGAALAGAVALASSGAAAQGGAMHQGMTYRDVERLLDLKPNATCGYVRVTYLSPQRIAPGGLPAPFAAGRPMGSALYFMLTPQEPVKLHRIRNDQLYHYYLGDPIEVLMMLTDGTTQHHIVGPDLRAGHTPQLLHSGQHVSHRAGDRIAAMVSRRIDRMAGRRACGCRARQCRSVGAEISGRRGPDPHLAAAGKVIFFTRPLGREETPRNQISPSALSPHQTDTHRRANRADHSLVAGRSAQSCYRTCAAGRVLARVS